MRYFTISILILLLSVPVHEQVQAQAQQHGPSNSQAEIMASLSGSNLSQRDKNAVSLFVRDLMNGGKSAVLKNMSFPVHREYPLPPLRNEEEFLRCYDTLFDRSFISSLTDGKWCDTGWRGISYNDGELWGDIDENGHLLIRSISTPSSKALLERLLRRQKHKLHKSVRDFSIPLIQLRSDSSIIRTDELSDGSIRYAQWSATEDISSAPELIIMNGIRRTEGSMSVRYYEFRESGYTYIIYEDPSSDDYPYHLEIRDATDSPVKSEGAIIEYIE